MAETSYWITVFTSIAAFVAALAALVQARATTDAFELAIYLEFTKRYNAEEMAASIRQLVLWYKLDEKNFATIWRQNLKKDDPNALTLNTARRLISRYFFDIGGLYQSRLISYKLARILTANVGLEVFLMICEPMNDTLDPERNHLYSDTIKRIRASYSGGHDYN